MSSSLEESNFRRLGSSVYCGGCGHAPYFKSPGLGMAHQYGSFTISCSNWDCRFYGQTYEVYPEVIEGRRLP